MVLVVPLDALDVAEAPVLLIGRVLDDGPDHAGARVDAALGRVPVRVGVPGGLDGAPVQAGRI